MNAHRTTNWRPLGSIAAAVTLFVSAYLLTFTSLSLLTREAVYWRALTAAIAATAFAIVVVERGRWGIGLMAPPRCAAIELVSGILIAAAIILSTDRLIALTVALAHGRGSGFPFGELAVVYIPAALHEEIVFRGYLFQKLLSWNRGAAIGLSSLAFAALHAGNRGVTSLAVANLAIAGVLLALAYEWRRRLWVPIGIHVGWNVVSGPVLGYGISGYDPGGSIWQTAARGPEWLTGGGFGIEGSVWILPVELCAVAALFFIVRRRASTSRLVAGVTGRGGESAG